MRMSGGRTGRGAGGGGGRAGGFRSDLMGREAADLEAKMQELRDAMASERTKRAGLAAKMRGNGGSMWQSARSGRSGVRDVRPPAPGALRERRPTPPNRSASGRPAPRPGSRKSSSVPEESAVASSKPAPAPKTSHTICCGPDDAIDMENEPPQGSDNGRVAAGGGGWSLPGLSGGPTGPDAWAAQEEADEAGDDDSMWNPAATVVEPRKESMDIQTEPPPDSAPKAGPKSSYFDRLFMSNASVWTTHQATLTCSLRR